MDHDNHQGWITSELLLPSQPPDSVVHLCSCYIQLWRWIHQESRRIGHPETAPLPPKVDSLWLKQDWQQRLFILISATCVWGRAEGRQQQCVPGRRRTQANSPSDPPQTLPHTQHLWATRTFPLMHSRGARVTLKQGESSLLCRFYSTLTLKWHFLQPIKQVCAFKCVLSKQKRLALSKSKVLHLPLKSRNSSDSEKDLYICSW